MALSTSTGCRSWAGGNGESCSLNVSGAGQYEVLVYGYSAYSGVSLVATHNGSGDSSGGGSTPSSYTNSDAVAIPDNSSAGIVSPLNVARSGDAGSVTIDLDITHTYIGDLRVTLTSPDGGQVVLHDNAGGGANDIKTSFQADSLVLNRKAHGTSGGQCQKRHRHHQQLDSTFNKE